MTAPSSSAPLPASPPRDVVLVEHAGALGDFVMIVPLVRALCAIGHPVRLMAPPARVRLVRDWLINPAAGPPARIQWIDPDSPASRGLWSGEAADAPSPLDAGVRAIITFSIDPARDDAAGRVHQAWTRAAKKRWPGAVVVGGGEPGSAQREAVWSMAGVDRAGQVAPRTNPRGPVVLHVGAGSPAKRWPLRHFAFLRAILLRRGLDVLLLAGEVEEERFTPEERGLFERAHGRYLHTLDDLARALAAARVVVANDSGPGHVAAQLGVAVVSLFGPTDPSVWGPVGPGAQVLAPPAPTPDLAWLDVDTVASRLSAWLEDGGAWA